jgi:hypothetical protein
MNKALLTTAFTALLTLSFVSDTFAQNRRDRGNRGNRGSGNSDSARQGGGQSRQGSATRQGSGRRQGSATTVNRDRLRQQNRDRMRSNNGGRTTTTRTNTRNTRVDRNTNRNPNRNTGSVNRNRNTNRNTGNVNRNPNRNTGRVNRNTNRNGGRVIHAGTRYNPRNDNRRYTPYRHQSRRNVLRHANRRYQRSSNYFNYMRSFNTNYIYRNWLMFPSTRANGYHVNNNYPFFVYNGYQHRYSTMDTCDYQLIDKNNDQVVDTFYNQTCSYGYDSCSVQRDQLNEYEYENRYFCAETNSNGYDY